MPSPKKETIDKIYRVWDIEKKCYVILGSTRKSIWRKKPTELTKGLMRSEGISKDERYEIHVLETVIKNALDLEGGLKFPAFGAIK